MLASRRLLSALAASATVLALAPSGASAEPGPCADQDLAASSATAGRVVAAVHCLVAAERAVRGLAPLERDPRLTAAAGGFAEQMREQDFFDHEGPDGSTPGSRVRDAGYAWSSVGENIAFGQHTARAVMTAWMRSEGHCENVLGAGFSDLGVGVAAGGGDVLWVQNFGRPRGVSAPDRASAAAACPAQGLTTSAASGGSGGDGATTGSAPGDAGSGAGASKPGTSEGLAEPDGGDGAAAGARIVFRVAKLRGGRLRISGTLFGAGRRTVRIEVRRGVRRNVRFVSTAGTFAVRMAGARGARVTVSAAGASRRTTVR